MKDLTLLDRKPVSHLKVPDSSWFYMNHLHGPQASSAHDHNFLEVAFILKGRARHFVVQGEEQCSAGDVYVIPVGAWHGYCDSDKLEICNCLLSPSLIEGELAWIKKDEVFCDLFALSKPRGFSGVRKVRLPRSEHRRLRALLGELETAYHRGSQTAILGRLLLVLDIVHAAAGDESLSNGHEMDSHPAIRRAVDLLYGQIGEEWTLEKLAGQLHLSPSYLVRLFRAKIGVSPMKFLSGVRADRAATLLLSGTMRIGDIGLAVGWPDPKHFAASFQRHFGLSASAYRKRMIMA